jgi:hypothetical protein
MLHTVSESIKELRALSQLTVADSDIDTEQLLIDYTACTNIEVTYLTITHLPFGQTHGFAIGSQFRVRVFLV